MIIDQNVREQVLDLRYSYLVQAPAGSGKTSLLVQRFLSCLAVVRQAPEEILALTFTRKAAAEMRDRIIAALELGLQNQPPKDEYNLKLWQLARAVLQRDQQSGWDLIDNPARLKIQTIDALCSNITAQMPIMAQFGAQPQTLDKPEPLYRLAVERLMQDSEQSSVWQQDFNILLSHLDNNRNQAAQLLCDMLAIRDQWLSVVVRDLPQNNVRKVLESSLECVVQNALIEIEDLMPPALDLNILIMEPPQELSQWLELADKLLTSEDAWRRTVTVAQGFPAPSSLPKDERELAKARKDAMLRTLEMLVDHELFRQHLSALRKLPPISYSDNQWQVLESLAQILQILVAYLILTFKDSGQVDFCQVALSAVQALGHQDPPSELSLALDCKLQHILLDEFQDTSLMQFQLLEKLTANWQNQDGRTLFLVGDPMQSIYRFRKADVSLFLQAKQHGIGNIQLHFAQLQVNFRSQMPIVQWINNVFSHSFPKNDDITYGAISYMPAEAAKPAIDDNIAVECWEEDELGQTARIVALIQEFKQSNPNKTIAILVRAKAHLKAILPALRVANIAFQGIELEPLKKTPLIQDLLSLTRAILHLDDRIAWLAILRAPWCGLLLPDLHIVAQGADCIWDNLQNPIIIAQLSSDAQLRAKALVTVMQAIILRRGRDAIDGLVQSAWHNLGGSQYVEHKVAIREATAYFDLLSQLSTQREIFSPLFLEKQLDNLYLQPDQIDATAVQIMTMHKAKGLEFDMVILPSLGKRTKQDKDRLLIIDRRSYPEECLLIAPIKSCYEQHDLIYKYLAWMEKQRQQFEDLRLLYVASTRAKQKLYCICPSDAKLLPVIAAQLQVSASIADDQQIEAQRTLKRLPSSYYQQFVKDDLQAPDAKTEIIQLTKIQTDWMRLVGIVVHRILCKVASVGIEKLESTIILQQEDIWQLHLRQLGLAPEYMLRAIALIRQALNNAFSDNMGLKFLSGAHLESYCEWPLTVRYGQQFKQYIIDRAFLDQDKIFWIVDYKTLHDDQELDAAVLRYTPQLLKYASAVNQMRPRGNIQTGLYFPLQQRWVAVF